MKKVSLHTAKCKASSQQKGVTDEQCAKVTKIQQWCETLNKTLSETSENYQDSQKVMLM